MKTSDIPACAAIVGETPLFAEYGFGAQAARKALRSAWADQTNHQAADLLVSCTAKGPEKITGFAWFIRKGAFQRSGYLRLIAVSGKVRSQGAGNALLEELEKRYLQPSGIFLLVTESNTGARRFYRRRGYRKVGAIPDYVKKGITECIYYKPQRYKPQTPCTTGAIGAKK